MGGLGGAEHPQKKAGFSGGQQPPHGGSVCWGPGPDLEIRSGGPLGRCSTALLGGCPLIHRTSHGARPPPPTTAVVVAAWILASSLSDKSGLPKYAPSVGDPDACQGLGQAKCSPTARFSLLRKTHCARDKLKRRLRMSVLLAPSKVLATQARILSTGLR